jgi:DNA transformation protein
MGTKDDNLSSDADKAAEGFIARINPLGDISSKKLFGGYGNFEGGKMFALVNSNGQVFLKANDTSWGRFEEAGSRSLGIMPYSQIPNYVMLDDESLFEWTGEAIKLSK